MFRPHTVGKPVTALATVVALAFGVVGCSAPTAESTPASSTSAAPANGTVTISWAGDNILGTDRAFSGNTLPQVWAEHGEDPAYFFQNVKKYFDGDDLTVANFEVALTSARTERYKGEGETYHFYGDPRLAKALPAGGIEAVTLSNNHTFDYLQKGFDDTVKALDDNGVAYFGTGSAAEGSDYDFSVLRTVAGVTVGLVGYQAWEDTPQLRKKIADDFASLRARGAQLVIPYFHWGIESQYEPYEVQRSLAVFAIDRGADAVIGTHPHVLQSMSTHRGKIIAYSLGNFSFGGNNNPTDKRTMILQTRFDVRDGRAAGSQFRVIPTRLSSTPEYNDYQPTPYTGAERAEVLGFINQISPKLGGTIGTEFTPVPAG